MPRWGEMGRLRRCLARISWPSEGVCLMVVMGLDVVSSVARDVLDSSLLSTGGWTA